MPKQLDEMDRKTRSELCRLIIDLKNISEEYNLTEIRSYGIKITIEQDRDEELMVK